MRGLSLNILRRYFYDPLNNLMEFGRCQTSATQRFYQHGHPATDLDQDRQTSIFRDQAQPLAQQRRTSMNADTTLLMTDLAQSVLQTLSYSDSRQYAFTAYGDCPGENDAPSLIGFNGESRDSITGHFPLGRGNRFYNPTLMRFNSADQFSPFLSGGINPYAYCGNNPINFSDPTGNIKRAFVEDKVYLDPVAWRSKRSPPPAKRPRMEPSVSFADESARFEPERVSVAGSSRPGTPKSLPQTSADQSNLAYFNNPTLERLGYDLPYTYKNHLELIDKPLTYNSGYARNRKAIAHSVDMRHAQGNPIELFATRAQKYRLENLVAGIHNKNTSAENRGNLERSYRFLGITIKVQSYRKEIRENGAS